MDVQLTLAEMAEVLEPPLHESQLRMIVQALGWQPDGWRHTGRAGHPTGTYSAEEIFKLHAAVLPFVRSAELAQNRV